ncbi:MAG: SPOR domain-containing protein [Gammaproteobacteria bacterium]
MKNKFIASLITIIILLTCIATAEPYADTYSVQIAAYKQLPDKLVKSVEQYGSVHISHHGELSRVSVGNFAHKSAAEKLLSQLKQAGYKDAFISRINTQPSSIENPNKPHASETPSSPTSEMAKFRNLSKSDKDRAVFINNRLHLKEGNRFILVP